MGCLVRIRRQIEDRNDIIPCSISIFPEHTSDQKVNERYQNSLFPSFPSLKMLLTIRSRRTFSNDYFVSAAQISALSYLFSSSDKNQEHRPVANPKSPMFLPALLIFTFTMEQPYRTNFDFYVTVSEPDDVATSLPNFPRDLSTAGNQSLLSPVTLGPPKNNNNPNALQLNILLQSFKCGLR